MSLPTEHTRSVTSSTGNHVWDGAKDARLTRMRGSRNADQSRAKKGSTAMVLLYWKRNDTRQPDALAGADLRASFKLDLQYVCIG